jgi:hypothetical protein
MFLSYWVDLLRASISRPKENSIRVVHSQNDSNRAASERFRTKVAMLGRFITEPKLRAVHGKPCYYASVRPFEAKDLKRSECGLIEVNGAGTIPN